MENPYALAIALANNGALDKAWKVLSVILNDNPNDIPGLVAGGDVMLRMGMLPQAYHFARRVTELRADLDDGWLNLGHAASQMCLNEEAEKCYRRGLALCKSAANRNAFWTNLSGFYIDTGNFEKAEKYARLLLDVDGDRKNALANLGFCQLSRRDWEPGWKNYHNTVGTSWRKRVRYKDEPEWDGTPGKNVVVYADQGLGDEISFASQIPDAAAICRKLILDCDGRLEGLFRRSFPMAKVYGTRVKDEKWAKEDREIDASLPLGQLGEIVRLKDSDFSGLPYLVPCPDRVLQWKTLFSTKKKPIVGIAWTGGVPRTNARNRRVSLEDLLPILSLEAHFVSLQYKDASDEIKRFKVKHPEVDLVQYSWATLTDDYDDTAALIACCDYVVCIQTAVARTAGALGVPTKVLVPTASNWFYGKDYDSNLWHRSLDIIRQDEPNEWRNEIARAARELNLGGLQKAAGTAPRDEQRLVRNGFAALRTNGVGHSEPDADRASA